jgi:hypothetical protein
MIDDEDDAVSPIRSLLLLWLMHEVQMSQHHPSQPQWRHNVIVVVALLIIIITCSGKCHID